jgi:predicted amidophosphoribosyltransferase
MIDSKICIYCGTEYDACDSVCPLCGLTNE